VNYLSLFSGIGGLDLGLDRAGMTCVGQVEINPFCRRVLAKHWPEVPRHDDVRTAPDWWVGLGRTADLVAGGVPCQPFSTAGKREGVGDARWGWPWFWDVVCVVRPRYVLVENVAALVADRDAFGIILADLAAGGYDAEWDCIPAAAVGAPHRRDRVFLVAHTQRDLVRVEPVSESRRGGEAEPGDDGAAWAVADTHRAGLEGPRELHHPPTDAGPVPGHGGGCSDVADPDGERLEGSRLPEGRRTEAKSDAGGCGPRFYRRGLRPGGEWPAEPEVGRVAHGVPVGVVRPQLQGLGNAVVPQVAEYIGRLILGEVA
jgi:site-specific DNA-cytosine methylase